jgi:hypothetical protein
MKSLCIEGFGDRFVFVIAAAGIASAGEYEDDTADIISGEKIGGHIRLKIIFGITGSGRAGGVP